MAEGQRGKVTYIPARGCLPSAGALQNPGQVRQSVVMAATVDTSTDLRGRDLPASASELERAHIAPDTPVEVQVENDRVIYQSVDSMERIEAERADRRLTGEEFLGSLDRISALPPDRD